MIPSISYTTIAAIALAFVLATVIVRLVGSVVRRLLDALDVVSAEDRKAVHERAQRLMRTLTLFAYGLAAIGSIALALSRFGRETEWDPRVVAAWFATHGVNVLVVFAGAFIVVRAGHLVIDHLQFKVALRRAPSDLEWQRRATTLGGILRRLVTATIFFVAVLMLLREFAIDVMPILTGAGIAGLAIGFGAQNLVRDVISGFFLILEDQVRIGDAARINGVAGTVEQINLRTIILRDAEGAVQVFPNGTITALANLSKQFAYAVVDVRVSYYENIDRVLGTLREVGASMEKDPAWAGVVLEPLAVLGIESLDGGAATIKMKFKTLPLHQGRVANELRRRVMGAFVGRGIKPYA